LEEIKQILNHFRKDRDFDGLTELFTENVELREDLFQIIKNKIEYPYSEHASWILTHFTKVKPTLTQKKSSLLIDILFETDNQSVLRNVLNTLNQLKLSDYRESEFIDLLVNFILDKNNKVALHVYSIQLLIQFVKKYPDLKQEIDQVLSIQVENASPAYYSAVKAYHKIFDKKQKP
jgi:hypothetical protein